MGGVESKSSSEKPKSLFSLLFPNSPKAKTARRKIERRKSSERIKIKKTTREQLGNIAQKAKISYDIVKKSGVLETQRKLKKLGYLRSAADGIYGPKTYQAVVLFQEKRGLKPDGIIGKETLRAIRSSYTPKLPKKSNDILGKNLQYKIERTYKHLTRTQIKKMQRYFGLRVTGKVNSSFVKKIAQFQHVLNGTPGFDIDVDGIAGPETYRAFLRVKDNREQTPRSSRDIKRANKTLRNSEKVKGIKGLPEKWGKIYGEFFQKLSVREQREVKRGKPFSLVNARNKTMVFFDGKRSIEMGVILGAKGCTKGRIVKGNPRFKANDQKTPVEHVHRFVGVNYPKRGRELLASRKEPLHPDLMPADFGSWRKLRYNKSVQAYYGEKYSKKYKRWIPGKRVTVVGGSIQSSLDGATGGRYFHLVGPNRRTTHGCVGIKWKYREAFKKMMKVTKSRGGFGYTSRG